MNLGLEYTPILDIAGMDDDCLIELMSTAEREQGSVDENPRLARALDANTLMVSSDGDVELLCKKCPVICSVKNVGGSAIVLFQGADDCAKRS